MNHRIFAASLLFLSLGCAGQSMIPPDVSYPIIKDEDEYTPFSKKRMVEVRLNTKVSPEILKAIALDVKSKEKRQYERTLIFVYLPEEVPGVKNSPWATCHFDPKLNVRIIGSTKENEDALRKRTLTHPGKRIGAWLLEGPGACHIHLIYEDAGAVTLRMFAAKEHLDSEMRELPSAGGRRFQVEDSDEVYDVDPAGVLRMYNRQGKVFLAAKPLP